MRPPSGEEGLPEDIEVRASLQPVFHCLRIKEAVPGFATPTYEFSLHTSSARHHDCISFTNSPTKRHNYPPVDSGRLPLFQPYFLFPSAGVCNESATGGPRCPESYPVHTDKQRSLFFSPSVVNTVFFLQKGFSQRKIKCHGTFA